MATFVATEPPTACGARDSGRDGIRPGDLRHVDGLIRWKRDAIRRHEQFIR